MNLICLTTEGGDMKKRISFVLMVVFLFSLYQSASTQIIVTKELANIYENDDVIILSARKFTDYQKVHIPGAVNVWHMGLYKDGAIKGLLKSPEEIATILGNAGISADKKIIVYDSGVNMFAGRMYWILKYLGCEDVHVLDGQMKMWRKGRKPVTRKATAVSPTAFQVKLNEGLITSKSYVKAHHSDAGVVLVDVRSKDEYDGKAGVIERKGHIAGAIHFEYTHVLNEDGSVKSKADLEKVTKEAGITPDKEIILHCETSVRAGIVYLALTSILDFPKVRVYDGALFEWSADSACPME